MFFIAHLKMDDSRFVFVDVYSSKLTWRSLENPPFLIGNTSSFMVDFPASHVSLPEGKNLGVV